MASGWQGDINRRINNNRDILARYGGFGGVFIGLQENAQDYPRHERGQRNPPGYVSEVVFVGYIHETGLVLDGKYKGWLRKAIDKDMPRRNRDVLDVLRRSGDNLRQRKVLLDRVGDKWTRQVREVVSGNQVGLPRNALSTIRKKRSNVPMYDTEHLVQQIDYKVEVSNRGTRR